VATRCPPGYLVVTEAGLELYELGGSANEKYEGTTVLGCCMNLGGDYGLVAVVLRIT